MPDYKSNDPKCWCGDPSRGAAMGRATIHDASADFAGKLTLRRVHLTGDYDENGTYWGGGEGTLSLFWYASDDGRIDACLRATDRDDAKRQIAEHYPRATFDATDDASDDVENFFRAYVECALWSSQDDDGPLDARFDFDDIAPEALATMREECAAFQRDNADMLRRAYAARDYNVERAGHDYWLTRNGHGAGFWDRGLGEIGEALSNACRYHGCNLYVDDNGKVRVE